MRVGVVGHVEWIEFAVVDHVPVAGEIVHATKSWEEPGGGGAVAALQLAKLAGACDFFAAVGNDEIGLRSVRELSSSGVEVFAETRTRATRKGVTLVDSSGERTITTLGERLHPDGADALPWNRLTGAGAVFITAGDADAVRRAREARVVVATSRVLDLIAESGIRVEAIVGSGRDPLERYDPAKLSSPPDFVVMTDGRRGGTFESRSGEQGTFPAAPLPRPVVDTYGAGDSFAGGLTWALGAGYGIREALDLAARCGAYAVTGRGVHAGQLRSEDIGS